MTATTINGKKPKFLKSSIAEDGAKNIIPETGGEDVVSQQLGFGSKFSTPRGQQGKSVSRADMNGLFHDVSTLNYYFQYMGRNPWVNPGDSNDNAYPKGAKVWHNEAEYVSTDDTNKTEPGTTGAKWIKLNDLSGTSGGGSTVDCAWSSRTPEEISGLLSNAGKITGLETKIDAISGDVSTLTSSVSALSEKISSIDVKISGVVGGDVLYDPNLYDISSVTAQVHDKFNPVSAWEFTFDIPSSYANRGFKILSFNDPHWLLKRLTTNIDTAYMTYNCGLYLSYTTSSIETEQKTFVARYGASCVRTLSSTTNTVQTFFDWTAYNLPTGFIKGGTIKAMLPLYNNGSTLVGETTTASIVIAKLKSTS